MEGRSLFALVQYIDMSPRHYAILQLNHGFPLPREVFRHRIQHIQLYEKLRFDLPKEPGLLSYLPWLFSPPDLEGEASSADSYMVPNWDFDKYYDIVPTCGYKFNVSDGRFEQIELPAYYKQYASVVSLKGKIYLSSNDGSNDLSCFQCYDPGQNSWKPLQPFPRYPTYFSPYVTTTALWDDTILLNSGSAGFWAYDVTGDKWYPVEYATDECQSIVTDIANREAVVVGSTIYALTEWSVVALSISKEGIGGNPLVFKCSLLSDIMVDQIRCYDDYAEDRSRHLVHLGENKFCVVQTCIIAGDIQPMYFTYIESMSNNSLKVIGEELHEVVFDREIEQHVPPHNLDSHMFQITLCFSLPKDMATALKQGKSFCLHPYPKETYASNPVQEEENVTPVKEENATQTLSKKKKKRMRLQSNPVQEEENATPVKEENATQTLSKKKKKRM